MNNTGLRVIGLSFIICHLSFSGIAAQDEGQYRYDDATQLWRLTGNAAGLGIDLSRNRGFAEFQGEHREGDYHRVQEGGQRNQLRFNTERYQNVGQWLVGYGRFTFDMDRTKDRAWCDVMRPYDSDPFFPGSSVKGSYDTQRFDLSAALATRPIPLASDGADRELNVGMRLDYKVGDLSRLRDPRSRSELLDYKIAPAVAYTFGRSTVGLAGHYNRRKEKIPNITTVQQDPNLVYYQMTGLGEASGLVGGYSGYQREWVNHELGAELNFGYKGNFQTVNAIGIARGVEDIWGQYKYSPGRYTSYIYKAASHNVFKRQNGNKAKLHQLDFEASAQQGYGDEYRQQLIQEKDPERGYTSYRYEKQMEYKKRVQVTTYDVSLHYRYSQCTDRLLRGYLGAKADLLGATNKHLLPDSKLDCQRINLSVEAGNSLFNDHLFFDAVVTYSHAAKADLSLADATTDYASQVLLPDMQYYNADYRRGQLSVKYLFPLMESTAYIKGYVDVIKAQHSLSQKTFGVTIGIFN